MSDEKQLVPPVLPPEQVPLTIVSGRRWSFSLRTLLLCLTALAILFGLAKAFEIDISAILIQLIYLALSGVLVTGVFFAKDDRRAFCIGGTIVLSSKWFGESNRFWFVMADTLTDATDSIGIPRSFLIEWFYLGFIIIVAIVNGLLCIRARRFFEDA